MAKYHISFRKDEQKASWVLRNYLVDILTHLGIEMTEVCDLDGIHHIFFETDNDEFKISLWSSTAEDTNLQTEKK